MRKPRRQLTLYKGLEKFIFRYEQGQEDRLFDTLIEYAREGHTGLDWFDVATLSLKLTWMRRRGLSRPCTGRDSFRM